MDLNMELLQELVNLVKNAQISELTVRAGDWRVTIRRNFQPAVATPTAPSTRHGEQKIAIEEKDVGDKGQKESPYVLVTSNWVGIVRRMKNGKLLVQVGDTVKRGQVLCGIDSLGVQNEVRSPVSGRVVEIYVEDGQPVEFGQKLMLVEVTGGDRDD